MVNSKNIRYPGTRFQDPSILSTVLPKQSKQNVIFHATLGLIELLDELCLHFITGKGSFGDQLDIRTENELFFLD